MASCRRWTETGRASRCARGEGLSRPLPLELEPRWRARGMDSRHRHTGRRVIWESRTYISMQRRALRSELPAGGRTLPLRRRALVCNLPCNRLARGKALFPWRRRISCSRPLSPCGLSLAARFQRNESHFGSPKPHPVQEAERRRSMLGSEAEMDALEDLRSLESPIEPSRGPDERASCGADRPAWKAVPMMAHHLMAGVPGNGFLNNVAA
ncbi:hypothetical protein SAMN05880592_101906 [Bosea sp. TND4EK4]|nr:hypothetical protein SAMN05880592_101906 [Bosea sp. TND4EK4]